MKKPVRFLKLMVIAIRAINGIRKVGGEERFKFFLSLLGLQQTATTTNEIPALTELVIVASAVVEQTPAPITPAPKPGTILSAPTLVPDKPLPTDRSERVMKGEAPKLLASGDFAAKLNGAAVALGKEDKSVLGRLRKILDDCVSKGREYWDGCREATEDALRGADLTDSDWDLLVKKMKHNLFFTGGKAELFINRCPKEKLTHLLLDQDGLTGLVAQIRVEEYENKSSAYRIAFILDASKKVGSDAKVLVENCKHAVNRMKQRGFIPADHWLVGKVRDLSRSKLPERKFANLDGAVISADVPAEVQTEASVLVQPEVVLSVEATVVELTDPDTMTMEELEARTAPEVPVNGDDKPEKLDPVYAAQFAAAMGESITVN